MSWTHANHQTLCTFGGGAAPLLPYTLDFTGLSAFPVGWTAPNWAVSANTAKNTPTVGVEKITNGDMETGDPPSNWTAVGVTHTRDADAHSGSYASKAVAADGSADRIGQVITAVAGTWYLLSVWAKRGTQGTSQAIRWDLGDEKFLVAGAAYQEYIITQRALITNPAIYLYAARAGLAGDIAFYDDVSVKPITVGTLFASRDFDATDVIIKAACTIIPQTQSGVVVRLDSAANPQNFIIGYHDGLTARLAKCVGGTYTSLISTATAYSAGANVEVRTSGNTVQLFYNNAQVGADQTVSDAGIISNTIHGLFSTYVGSTVSTFSAEAN